MLKMLNFERKTIDKFILNSLLSYSVLIFIKILKIIVMLLIKGVFLL